jgi:hypothetical protein
VHRPGVGRMNTDPRAKVARLPATGCRSYFQGRCLYGEQLNPGLDSSTRCEVLRRWEAMYDDFLDRAERFGVTEASAPELWRRRFERLAGESLGCPDFASALGVDMPECQHLFADLCLLRLPECQGKCRNYRLHGKD